MSDTAQIFAAVISIIGTVISVIWIAMPFIVYRGFRRMEELAKRQNQLLYHISDRQNETNRAMQYLVERLDGAPDDFSSLLNRE